MDCGAWRLDDTFNCDFVVRIRGNEHHLTNKEMREFYTHMESVIRWQRQESCSEDYYSIPKTTTGQFLAKASSLLEQLGLKKSVEIKRRF